MFFSFFLMITQLHIFESLARVDAEDPEMIPIKPTIIAHCRWSCDGQIFILHTLTQIRDIFVREYI